MRPTRAEIDLAAIRHNIEAIRNLTGAKVMMAIKADAYGHGSREVGKFVEKTGLAYAFGVTSIEEGVELRQAGVKLPILIFSIIDRSKEDIDALFTYDLKPTIVDKFLIDALVAGAKRRGKKIGVHIKTDTGMGRLGLAPIETLKILKQVSEKKEICIEGVYTHFPVADSKGDTFTEHQISMFNGMIDEAEKNGIKVGLKHCANSGAILNTPSSYMDMVRPGILCYGLYPSHDVEKKIKVIPAMTFKTGIIFVKRVKKGTCLSYGLTYRPEKDTNIATIPAGYADGYHRGLSNNAKVIINNKTYPVVGRVCMDMSLIDLGNDTYPIGQEIILFGKETVTADTVASWLGTIPYEVTCNMSRRVVRTYTI
jgi:alanine racemase